MTFSLDDAVGEQGLSENVGAGGEEGGCPAAVQCLHLQTLLTLFLSFFPFLLGGPQGNGP